MDKKGWTKRKWVKRDGQKGMSEKEWTKRNG